MTAPAAKTNGLSKEELARDLKEAAANVKHHRAVKKAVFKVVAPGVRSNSSRSASHRYEVIASFYVGAFPSVAKAAKARERFIQQVDKFRTA